MKSLRRSLNNDKENKLSSPNQSQPSPPLPGPHSNPLSRPAASGKVAPPQKVIKALKTHRSTNPQELSYQEGDFWYVTSERDGWFEALNPLTGSRGLVPKSDFEEFIKGGRAPSGTSHRSGSAEQPASRSQTPSQSQFSPVSNPRSPASNPSPPALAGPPRKPVYAIVQYDFAAERPDELDAKKGEPIVVIAQSNHEWFVAKPIGRLGGPGLIPVAFVEIRDPATGRPIEVLPDTIPMVEEWKKATADYKAAAIPLGRFDFAPDTQQQSMPHPQAPQPPTGPPSAYAQSTRTGSTSQSQPQSQHSSVPRSTSHSSIGHVNGNGNGARHELYRPEQDALLPPGEMAALEVPSFHMEDGNFWFRLQVLFYPEDPSVPAYALSLYRTYEDFYDFQINLLDTFPFEAGRPAPGKEDQSPPERILPYMPGPVEDEIDNELTEYRREELDAYVKALVDLRLRGAGYILRHDLIRGFFAARYGDHCQESERQDGVEELDEGMANARISDGHGRGGQPDQRAPSAMSRNSQKSSTAHSIRQSGGYPGQGHPQSQPSHSRQASRGPSPMQTMAPLETSSGSNSRQHAPQSQTSGSLTPNPGHLSGPLSTAITSSSWGHPPNSAASSSVPPPPASGQPPYIKIKIYDRATDDLIAIRVHPNVTYDELYEKVHARLGTVVSALRYKDGSISGGSGYQDIRDDAGLRHWMSIEDQKLVLYAEQ